MAHGCRHEKPKEGDKRGVLEDGGEGWMPPAVAWEAPSGGSEVGTLPRQRLNLCLYHTRVRLLFHATYIAFQESPKRTIRHRYQSKKLRSDVYLQRFNP